MNILLFFIWSFHCLAILSGGHGLHWILDSTKKKNNSNTTISQNDSVTNSSRSIGVGEKITQTWTRTRFKTFFLAAVENVDDATPIIKAMSKGATVTAIDNPKMVMKVLINSVLPKMLMNLRAKMNQIAESIKKCIQKLFSIDSTNQLPGKEPTSIDTKPKNPAKKFLLSIRDYLSKGLMKIGKDIEAVNQGLLVQLNGLGIKFAAKNGKALAAAQKFGSNTMKEFLKDPEKFEDPVLDEFLAKLKKEHPAEFEKIQKAQIEGAIEAVKERLEKIRAAFVAHVKPIHEIKGNTRRDIVPQNSETIQLSRDIINIDKQFDSILDLVSQFNFEDI